MSIYLKKDDSQVHPDVFDPIIHYRGTSYPNFDYPPNCQDISDQLYRMPYGWLRAALDDQEYIHTPLSLKDYRQGKLTKIKLGRYLLRFWPDHFLNNSELLKEFVDKFKVKEIHYAKTGAEMRWVYDHSPQHAYSCMAGKFKQWKHHPVEIYAAGDLQIAYTLAADGEVQNRTIIWPEKKVWARIYGDGSSQFAERLRALGYEQGNTIGARLQMLFRNKEQILIPYIDNHSYVSIMPDGSFLLGSIPNALKSFCGSEDGYNIYYREEVADKPGTVDYPHNLQLLRHPRTGYQTYFSHDIQTDPWGLADLRHVFPEAYTEGFPRYIYNHTVVCPYTNRRALISHTTTDPEYGLISYRAITELFRRDALTGTLIPREEALELEDGNTIRRP